MSSCLSQPQPSSVNPSPGSSSTITPIDPPLDLNNLHTPSSPNNVLYPQQAIPPLGFGTFKMMIPPLKDTTDNGYRASNTGFMKYVYGTNSYTVDIPGLYYVGVGGISKITPQQNSWASTELPPGAPATALESDADSDWGKESRWMKVRSIEPFYNKVPFDYRDLRKNWRRFAALSNYDKMLRFNTPRLREARRAVFGERVGFGGMRHRRDTGIDHSEKEAMVHPKIDLNFPRNRKKPRVFRSVPKIYYNYSSRVGKRSKTKPSAPQIFYDWTKRMEKKRYIESLTELTDFERFLVQHAQRDSSKTDLERFLTHAQLDVCNYSGINRDSDPDASGFGGYETSSDSCDSSNTDDENSGDSYTLGETTDEYASDDWSKW